MKLLFENWRKHINEESASQTKYLGGSPEEAPCIQKLRKWLDDFTKYKDIFDSDDPADHAIEASLPSYLYDMKRFARCMINDGYEYLGAGSFRMVFGVPGQPEVVLKIALPTGGLDKNKTMNKKEAQAAYQTASELVPKVYDSAPDYLWILSDGRGWHHERRGTPVRISV